MSSYLAFIELSSNALYFSTDLVTLQAPARIIGRVLVDRPRWPLASEPRQLFEQLLASARGHFTTRNPGAL
jgi:hypothetical protein